ncbi:response regulator transcription factor [Streptosporangium sp. KLBMP 9127]|nr:response regulator transcription factor [Streptosporangium sp. KLBMP 9127]
MTELVWESFDERISVRLSVGVVCENEILRFGLKAALAELSIVDVVRELPIKPALSAAESFQGIDVIVVSYTEWDAALSVVPVARSASQRVLVFMDDEMVKDPLKLASLRPDGFVLQRELTTQGLEEALLKVARSETPMPPEILTNIFDTVGGITEASRLRSVELTAREQDALRLLIGGLSNKEIAKRLSISLHGVKRLVGNILLKLNCPNRTQAVALAMKHGLVDSR